MPTPRECPAPGGPAPGPGPRPARLPRPGPGGLLVTASGASGSHSCWSASTAWWRRATCLTRRGPAWARSWRRCASTWRPSAPARTPGTAAQPDLQVCPGGGAVPEPAVSGQRGLKPGSGASCRGLHAHTPARRSPGACCPSLWPATVGAAGSSAPRPFGALWPAFSPVFLPVQCPPSLWTRWPGTLGSCGAS